MKAIKPKANAKMMMGGMTSMGWRSLAVKMRGVNYATIGMRVIIHNFPENKLERC